MPLFKIYSTKNSKVTCIKKNLCIVRLLHITLQGLIDRFKISLDVILPLPPRLRLPIEFLWEYVLSREYLRVSSCCLSNA